jgi:hypothetical protein
MSYCFDVESDVDNALLQAGLSLAQAGKARDLVSAALRAAYSGIVDRKAELESRTWAMAAGHADSRHGGQGDAPAESPGVAGVEPLAAREPEGPVVVAFPPGTDNIPASVLEKLSELVERLVDGGATRRAAGRPALSIQVTGFDAAETGLARAQAVADSLRDLVVREVKARSRVWLRAAGLTSHAQVEQFADELVPPSAARFALDRDRAGQAVVSIAPAGDAGPLALSFRFTLDEAESWGGEVPVSFGLAAVAHFLAAYPRDEPDATQNPYADIAVHGVGHTSDLARANEFRGRLIALVAKEVTWLIGEAERQWADKFARQRVLPVARWVAGGAVPGVTVSVRSRASLIRESYPWLPQINPYHQRGGEFATNCLLAAIAVDRALATGEVWQIPPTGPQLLESIDSYAPDRPRYLTTLSMALAAMSASPADARGMLIFRRRNSTMQHIVNIVNDPRLGVTLLDGQAGGGPPAHLQPSGEDKVYFRAMSDGIPVPPIIDLARGPRWKPRPVLSGGAATPNSEELLPENASLGPGSTGGSFALKLEAAPEDQAVPARTDVSVRVESGVTSEELARLIGEAYVASMPEPRPGALKIMAPKTIDLKLIPMLAQALALAADSNNVRFKFYIGDLKMMNVCGLPCTAV